MTTDGPTTGELDKAKGFYAGSYPFKLQTAGGVASALVAAEQHGLYAAYVRELPVRLAAVDQPKAKTVAGELLHPNTLLVVIVGKASVIEPQIADKGIAYERIGFKAPINSAARAAAKAKAPRRRPRPRLSSSLRPTPPRSANTQPSERQQVARRPRRR